jgi:hypothetical protein
VLNEQLVRGVNLFETMYYPASSPTGEGRGGPSAVMRDPGWPLLMDYIRRMSYVLSMGRPAADVALYLPSDSMWMNDKDADQQFVAAERLLSEHQTDFDIIGVDSLAADLKAGKGTFETASGNAYRTVILPSPSVLSQAAVGRLKAFAAGGGHVVFLGHAPGLIYTRDIKDGRASQPADTAFATVIPGELPAVPTPPAQAPDAAPGPMIVPQGVLDALRKALPEAKITLDHNDPTLKVLTRRLKDADVVLLFNESAQESVHHISLHAAGHSVERWDAASATTSAIPAKSAGNASSVEIDLKPYETELLMIR